MKFRFAALAATFLASTASFAGVVTGSSNIDFLAIDGQKPAKSMLKENHAFNVNDTQKHQVVVRVSEIIQSGSDRVLFESDPIVVASTFSVEPSSNVAGTFSSIGTLGFAGTNCGLPV